MYNKNQYYFKLNGARLDLETLTTENMTLSKRVQCDAEDRNSLIDKMQQLELQVITINEKHKICQQEVKKKNTIAH